MKPLDYQNPDDARSEQNQRLRLKLFGPRRADVWKVLADEIGARFEGGRFWNEADRVVADVDPWEIVLDTYVVPMGKTVVRFTRMRAPFVNADGFRFAVSRKNVFSGLGKLLGAQDVTVGHPAFDDAFVIKGNNEPQLRRLFANPRLRELIEAQPTIHFTVKPDDGLFRRKYPAGVDELRFTVPGVIKDLDRLKSLYDLFAETLNTLCQIGAAYEDDPGVTPGG
jgi:hypothetical protein